jgi:hypothetical protein
MLKGFNADPEFVYAPSLPVSWRIDVKLNFANAKIRFLRAVDPSCLQPAWHSRRRRGWRD